MGQMMSIERRKSQRKTGGVGPKDGETGKSIAVLRPYFRFIFPYRTWPRESSNRRKVQTFATLG